MRVLTTFSIDNKVLDMLQAYYEEYRSRQDIIEMAFEIHKFDEDASVIQSVPFKYYERQFIESKIQYDTLMSEIQKKYIPDEYKKNDYKFEVNFDDKVIEIIGR